MYMDILSIFKIMLLSSLIGSVIVLMILIIKGIFKNKLSSNFHYYIWLILIIKLVIPIGPQTPLNISNIYKNFYVESAINENTQIDSSKQLDNSSLDGSTSINTLTPTSESVIDSTINTSSKSEIDIVRVFSFIWMFGVLILIGTLVTGHKKLKDIINSSMKNITSAHEEILCICMKTMNIRNEVELSYSSKISSPSLCGIIKPKILIPISVAENVCDEEFKYIIMHELTHLKNKDIFINWVITLLSIIYWFNPILLYGFHKMRQDLEISCDARVISYLDKGKNLQYGNAIVRVLELRSSNSNRLIGTTSMVMNSSEIKRRIIMISKYKKANIKNILLGAIIVVILGGIGIALNTSKSKEEKPVVTSEEFIRNIYTVDEEKVDVFKKLLEAPIGMIGEGVPEGSPTGPSEEYIKIAQSLDKNIQPLMTKEGYQNTVADQFNTKIISVCAKGDYTAKVTKVTLGENVYKEYKDNDKVRYPYEVKFDFISSDGKTKQADIAKGNLDLVKEDGTWKVCLFSINQVPELYLQLFKNK